MERSVRWATTNGSLYEISTAAAGMLSAAIGSLNARDGEVKQTVRF
jgi:hypothetical protein